MFWHSAYQADGRVVLRVFDQFIHCRQIKAQLAQMHELELAALQLDDHITVQFEVIEQQVDENLVATPIHPIQQ